MYALVFFNHVLSQIEYLRKVLVARMNEGSSKPQKLFIYVKIIYNKTVQTPDLSL